METISKKSSILVILGVVLIGTLVTIKNTTGFEKLLSLAFLVTVLVPMFGKSLVFVLTPDKPKKQLESKKEFDPNKIMPSQRGETFHSFKEVQKKESKPQKIVNTQGYIACQNIVKACFKHSLLSHSQILDIVDLLNSKLGEHVKNYRNFTFQNDAHEIYTKLKSSKLKSEDYFEITNYISNLINKEEIKDE